MILGSYPSGMNQNYVYRLLKWEGSHTPCTLGSLRWNLWKIKKQLSPCLTINRNPPRPDEPLSWKTLDIFSGGPCWQLHCTYHAGLRFELSACTMPLSDSNSVSVDGVNGHRLKSNAGEEKYHITRRIKMQYTNITISDKRRTKDPYGLDLLTDCINKRKICCYLPDCSPSYRWKSILITERTVIGSSSTPFFLSGLNLDTPT
ncbi:hypothetical protein NQ317_018694 [Molorchus minor]|uniref:Uncharacterized protein n=1 Tax=Molorchus minor TaxID=1323400 RepID=A0ABQ9JI18_9CUCU|nr:hypothetical protein NQ317_018694 [Molorchus minor]